MNNKLSSEVVSLIHHIKLNEGGWQEKAIQSLIISTFGNKNNSQLSKDDIFVILTTEINSNIDRSIFNKQIEILCSNKHLISIGNNVFNLSDEKYKEYQSQFDQQIEIENKTYNLFLNICERYNPSQSAKEIWEDFIENLLLPIIKQIGAKTNEWISGKYTLNFDEYPQHQKFILKYGNFKNQISAIIFEFLDFRNDFVKKYILSQRDAYFFVQATGLETKDVEAIYKNSKTQTDLKIFVDTNFLLTLLDLHDNPSNEATFSLLDLVNEVQNKVRIKFYILPVTIDELRNLLFKFKDYLQKIRPSLNYAIAAENSSEFSGILKKYFERSVKQKGMINLDDYFDPYLNNFTVTIRSKGIGLEVHNQDLSSYGTNPKVVEDIVQQTEYRMNRLREAQKLKTLSQNEIEFQEIRIEDKFKHDCILWHVTKDKRPSYIDSPKDVKEWVVTLDYGFLAFDRFKQKSVSSNNVNICLHPNELVSMLQFWVPRTKAFEDAILGNFRLPFLFRETDIEGEKVSIEILKALSFYEGSNEFSSDHVTEILTNNAIRQKISPSNTTELNAELIREEVFKKYEEAQEKLRETETQNVELKDEITQVKNTVNNLSTQLDKIAIEIKNKAEQDLVDYNKIKVIELNSKKQALETELENLITRHKDFLNLLNKANIEIEEKTNNLSYKFKSMFNSEQWQIEFKKSITDKYLDTNILKELADKIAVQEEKLKNTVNPIENEKIIVLCEGNNELFFNSIGFDQLYFKGVKNSSAVFIQTIANPTYFGLRDRDYLSDIEIKKLKIEYPNLIITGYYCYENYLYHPDNIDELNLSNFDIEGYKNDMISQKNEKLEFIISSLIKAARNSYQEFNAPKDSDKFKDKNELEIVQYLKSDDIEIFLKSFSLKDTKLFSKHLLAKYNLNETKLTNTKWFKTKIGEIISIK